jgi:hypothetical protein
VSVSHKVSDHHHQWHGIAATSHFFTGEISPKWKILNQKLKNETDFLGFHHQKWKKR